MALSYATGLQQAQMQHNTLRVATAMIMDMNVMHTS